MDTRISLHKIEVFRLILQAGGVTRAAERLGVAQPAVSAQLRSFESAMGAPLFTRERGRLVLTEAGERVAAWADEVLAGVEQVTRDVADLSSGNAGSITVAASMAIGSYLLPPIMTRLRSERPGVNITVHIGEPAHALRAVRTGEADLAVVTWDAMSDTEGLHAEKLWDEPIVLCASPHGPPDESTIELAALAELPMVGAPKSVAFASMLERQLRDHGVDRMNTVIRLGHADSIKQAAAQNRWTCLMPAYCLGDDVAAGRLRLVTIVGAQLSEGVGLVRRQSNYSSALAIATIRALKQFGRQRPQSATLAGNK